MTTGRIDPEAPPRALVTRPEPEATRWTHALRSEGIEAEAPAPKDPVEEAFKALLTAWTRAPMAARRRFVHEVSDDLAAMEGQAE